MASSEGAEQSRDSNNQRPYHPAVVAPPIQMKADSFDINSYDELLDYLQRVKTEKYNLAAHDNLQKCHQCERVIPRDSKIMHFNYLLPCLDTMCLACVNNFKTNTIKCKICTKEWDKNQIPMLNQIVTPPGWCNAKRGCKNKATGLCMVCHVLACNECFTESHNGHSRSDELSGIVPCTKHPKVAAQKLCSCGDYLCRACCTGYCKLHAEHNPKRTLPTMSIMINTEHHQSQVRQTKQNTQQYYAAMVEKAQETTNKYFNDMKIDITTKFYDVMNGIMNKFNDVCEEISYAEVQTAKILEKSGRDYAEKMTKAYTFDSLCENVANNFPSTTMQHFMIECYERLQSDHARLRNEIVEAHEVLSNLPRVEFNTEQALEAFNNYVKVVVNNDRLLAPVLTNPSSKFFNLDFSEIFKNGPAKGELRKRDAGGPLAASINNAKKRREGLSTAQGPSSSVNTVHDDPVPLATQTIPPTSRGSFDEFSGNQSLGVGRRYPPNATTTEFYPQSTSARPYSTNARSEYPSATVVTNLATRTYPQNANSRYELPPHLANYDASRPYQRPARVIRPTNAGNPMQVQQAYAYQPPQQGFRMVTPKTVSRLSTLAPRTSNQWNLKSLNDISVMNSNQTIRPHLPPSMFSSLHPSHDNEDFNVPDNDTLSRFPHSTPIRRANDPFDDGAPRGRTAPGRVLSPPAPKRVGPSIDNVQSINNAMREFMNTSASSNSSGTISPQISSPSVAMSARVPSRIVPLTAQNNTRRRQSTSTSRSATANVTTASPSVTFRFIDKATKLELQKQAELHAILANASADMRREEEMNTPNRQVKFNTSIPTSSRAVTGVLPSSPAVQSSGNLKMRIRLNQKPAEPRAKEEQWDDYCAVCNQGGDLICCDSCPKVYHNNCHIPNIKVTADKLPDDWQCNRCMERVLIDSLKTGFSRVDREACAQVLMACYEDPVHSEPFEKNVPKSFKEYYATISHPMCFSIIAAKIENYEYDNITEFIADMNLVFANCANFNAMNSPIEKSARYVYNLYLNAVKQQLPLYVSKVWCYTPKAS